jgi:predicted RNase H-like HicB family nuclease
MRFLVRIYKYKGDYSALVPDLPGCVAAGDSVEEVRSLIAEAIKLHLDLMQKSGERTPKPSRHIDFAIDDSSDEEWCTWVDVKVANVPVAAASRRRRTG